MISTTSEILIQGFFQVFFFKCPTTWKMKINNEP